MKRIEIEVCSHPHGIKLGIIIEDSWKLQIFGY